ncbi:MAG: arylsulfatase A-like enzyme [Verrucomicrobiales bacterium]|jgi:arylsulfatase A-like enzyme
MKPSSTLHSLAIALTLLTHAVASERPNVVFVLTDDQGYGPLGCHGDINIKTPEMDRLHRESVRFTNFHVQPNCAPTRAMLLTGRPPLKNGVWATIRGRSLLKRDEATVADTFKAGGYKTALFGKWHLGDNYPFRPQDRGFDEVLIHGGGGVGNIQDYWANNYFDDYYQHNGDWKKFPGYCTDVWFGEALKFIEQNQNEPFFITIATNTPHLPLEAPKKNVDIYAALEAKPGVAPFYAMISNIDDNLGRLRAKLKKLDLEENTILIFMSDNGTVLKFATWNAGMSGGKGSTMDGGHRVPFFMHWPAGELNSGRDIDALTSGLDLRPTLEELCGLKRTKFAPEDGKSLVPLLRGMTPDWINRLICLDAQKQQRTPQKDNPHTVMQGAWRWSGSELHSLASDPGQKKNLALAHPERAGQMEAEYHRWWEVVNPQDPAAGKEIVIGSESENPCTLTAHDISGEVAWNHDQVLAGFNATGFWEIDIAQDGAYEFALRRYPAEAAAPIRGTIPVPEKLRKFRYFARDYDYAIKHERSKALPVVAARLKIGKFKERKAIAEQDEAIRFTAKLKAGKTTLEASFLDGSDSHVTAPYYITVTRR